MEAAMDWARSSRCHSSSCCVEVAQADGHVIVRSSAAPDREVAFSREEWATFVEGVKAGEFDPVR